MDVLVLASGGELGGRSASCRSSSSTRAAVSRSAGLASRGCVRWIKAASYGADPGPALTTRTATSPATANPATTPEDDQDRGQRRGDRAGRAREQCGAETEGGDERPRPPAG